MDPRRWTTVQQLFHELTDADPAMLRMRLEELRASDPELAGTLEALLAADAGPAPLLDGGALDPVVASLEELDAVPAAEGPSLLGTRIGPYRIVRTLGRGGMGIVFLGERDEGDFEQTVAIKLLRPGVGGPEWMERFHRERRILAGLAHPHIARLFDGGMTGAGEPYFVMEFVDGEPIDRHCDERSLSIDDRIGLFLDVCEAVQAAHERLVVHRDLKPGNLLVTAEGQVKLLDFGIAKSLEDGAGLEATATGRALTPEYASPEQVRGDPIGVGSDVYSLGVLLYRLLTGARPYAPRPGVMGGMQAVLEGDTLRASTVVTGPGRPVDASDVERSPGTLQERAARRRTTPTGLQRRLRGDLDVILETALELDPSDRYRSVQALHDDLDRHRTGVPIRARPPTRSYRARKFVRRHRMGVAAASAVAASVVLGLAAALWQAGVARDERDAARLEAERSTRVTDLLIDVFRSADPEVSQGADLSAREILERGVRRVESEFAEDPVLQATVRRALGEVHFNLGEYTEAVRLAEAALEGHRAALGPRSEEVARDLMTLGKMQTETADRDSLFRRGWELWLDLAGPDDVRTARAQTAWAQAIALSDADEAERLLRSALAVQRSAGNERGEAATLHALGLIRHDRAEYDEAETLYRQALDVSTRVNGETHPQTLATLSQLGWLLQLQGRHAASDTILRLALERRRAVLGPDHPALATTLNGLGETALARGAPAEALDHFRAALALQSTSSLPTPLSEARSLHLIARALTDLGRLDEAREHYDRAMEAFAAQPDSGTVFARALNDQARLLERAGDWGGAARAYRRAWQEYRDRLGEAHPFTATVLANLGTALLVQDSVLQAEPLLRSAAPHLEGRGRGVALVSLGSAELRLGRLAEAEATLREATRLLEANLPEGHWRIGQARGRLARTLAEARRLDESEAVALEAFEVLSAAREAAPYDYVQVVQLLEALQRAQGRPAEAERYAALIRGGRDR